MKNEESKSRTETGKKKAKLRKVADARGLGGELARYTANGRDVTCRHVPWGYSFYNPAF